MAQIIDGKAVANSIKQQIKNKIDHYRSQGNRAPGLAVILIGEDPASEIYVGSKRKSCEQLGIESIAHNLPDSTSQEKLFSIIDELNNNKNIDGILVQLPLPDQIDTTEVIERIQPTKDVDGFHPYNIGRLATRIPTMRSCTPYGVMKLLSTTDMDDIKGKQAIIVGASNHVGRPMGLELLLAGCTVTTCHRFTKDLESHVRTADILVVGVGKPHLIPGEWIKKGCIVIDIGMNRQDNGKLVGDVNFETASENAGWITPVPGGVGPMTVAMLMENTLTSYEKHFLEIKPTSA